MNWFIIALKNTFNFGGRARRKEYWMFTLFNLIFSFLISVIEVNAGLTGNLGAYGPMTTIYMIVMFIPALSVAIRRLHDTGRSGWWVLLSLIPIVGVLILLVFYVLDSQPGPNRFGPNPKEDEGKMVADF